MSDADLRGTRGENIAELQQNYDIAAEKATATWYSEVKNFTFAEPHIRADTGHFTQLVWRDSKNLGMGIARTRDGRYTIVVALYEPAGNTEGKVKENVRMPDEVSKRGTILSRTPSKQGT